MPLEACRDCGYALSVLDGHCRHCVAPLPTRRTLRFSRERLPQIAVLLAGVALLAYFILRYVFR